MAAAAGFLLGFPVLRLRGDYLAIVTLGFGEIVRILLLNNTEITGGPERNQSDPRNRLSSALSSAVPPVKAVGTRSVISLA
ncbi:high-affinity branched-chain amino acid ABC transporter permease [Escherichia coli]|uniref:High-affinity branched-chain amino acid ABC transporter permease n=1 Tax=Escherichia coli TaxID=562 RepID=A0A376TWX5_ECOLX|nr:high-affinity branched-chain amino acid ABC transporter permease [Escherichia coli]